MNEPLLLVLSGLAGGVLGVLFFGGLWWTVSKGLASPRPALWFLGSLLIRTAVMLAGFYLVGRGDGKRLLVCLFGFIITRFVVMRLTRPAVAPGKLTEEAKYASHA